MSALKEMFIIIERKHTEKLCHALKDLGAHSRFTIPAMGTARSDLLQVLGLDEREKTLVITTVTTNNIPQIKELLVKKFRFGRGGGIAFTTDVNSVAGPASLMILTGGGVK